jgi:PAS domain S-box-containing protein
MEPEVIADALEALNAISPVAVIGLDGQGRVDIWNAAASALFGWSEPEVAGHPLPPALESLNMPPESAAPAEARLKGKDGRDLMLELRSANRRAGGRVIVATPVSETVEVHSLELLEAAPDGIIEVDREGRIVLLNGVTEKLFGYTRAELLERNVDTLLPPALMARHAEHRRHYWANPQTRPMARDYVLKARRKDGSEFPAEICLSPVRRGAGYRVMAIIRDVTAQKKAEEEIRSANQQLELRSREAERANALKSEFLASMSHELRTPLHTIIGFTELLQEELEGRLNEKQKRFVWHVHQDSLHLLELINDILDLSKIEAGRMDLRIESVDVAELAAEIADRFRTAAQAKGILIDNCLTAPAYVLADRLRLREIMNNLLSNAVKFTPEGGRVWIESSQMREKAVEVAVRDTGIGIAPEDQTVIFDKFRQVASTTRGVREGTGLGLAIVKRLVEMHGGVISVESAPERGSRFAFTIPADPACCRTQPLALVIEDEPAARELLCGYLDRAGIRAQCAESAGTGLEIAREIRPDIILLDLLLPDRSGWRVLGELRFSPSTCSIPVIVTSVLDFDAAAIAAGAAQYLQKPLKKETVIYAVREHLPARFSSLPAGGMPSS